jgi:hypothetical protein
MLTQESLEKTGSIQRLEDAAAELYKALQAGRDTGKLEDACKSQNHKLIIRHRHGSHYGEAW